MHDDCRVIACSYDQDKDGKGIAPFTLFKTFDKDIAKEQLVIVPTNTRYGFTAVRVEELDVEWSPESTTPIDWIVGKLDPAHFENLKAQEKKALEIINAAEKRKQREEMKAKVTEHLKAEEKEALALAYSAPVVDGEATKS